MIGKSGQWRRFCAHDEIDAARSEPIYAYTGTAFTQGYKNLSWMFRFRIFGRPMPSVKANEYAAYKIGKCRDCGLEAGAPTVRLRDGTVYNRLGKGLKHVKSLSFDLGELCDDCETIRKRLIPLVRQADTQHILTTKLQAASNEKDQRN